GGARFGLQPRNVPCERAGMCQNLFHLSGGLSFATGVAKMGRSAGGGQPMVRAWTPLRVLVLVGAAVGVLFWVGCIVCWWRIPASRRDGLELIGPIVATILSGSCCRRLRSACLADGSPPPQSSLRWS